MPIRQSGNSALESFQMNTVTAKGTFKQRVGGGKTLVRLRNTANLLRKFPEFESSPRPSPAKGGVPRIKTIS
jgi:hypothetical protein